MQIRRLGLGIRFDFLNMVPDEDIQRLVFEELFSVLTLGAVKGLTVYGGVDPAAEPGENVYLAVFMGGKLHAMRRMYDQLVEDAAIGMYLCHSQPFIENNRLASLEGLTCFGEIGKDGRLHGGEAALPVRISKKRGRKRNVGRGVHMLVAPAAFGPISALEATKRITLAARSYFPGVRILPLPIVPGAQSVRALVTACNGSYRHMRTPEGALSYGVLRGKTAVMAALDSYATGKMIRRALDEGLREFYISPVPAPDEGMGCARALGVRFYDAEDRELTNEYDRIARTDTELIHPMLCRARFILMSREVTLGKAVMPLLYTRRQEAVEAILSAADFEKMLNGKALVVTGGEDIMREGADGARACRAILQRCAAFNVPVVALNCAGWEDPAYTEGLAKMSVVKIPIEPGMSPERVGQVFDAMADRMFRFIRLGRDVEKIGAPKREKRRVRYLPHALKVRLQKEPPLDPAVWAQAGE